jgi:hypothetical protein
MVGVWLEGVVVGDEGHEGLIGVLDLLIHIDCT